MALQRTAPDRLAVQRGHDEKTLGRREVRGSKRKTEPGYEAGLEARGEHLEDPPETAACHDGGAVRIRPSDSSPRSRRLVYPESKFKRARSCRTSMPFAPISKSRREAPSERSRPRKCSSSTPICWVTVRLNLRICAIASIYLTLVRDYAAGKDGARP